MRHFEWKDKSAYTYGLHGTPTTYMLEERLCSLEGGRQCLLVPSGLAAIATVSLALLKTGDEVLIPDNAYGPSKTLAAGELKHWGISHRYYDPMDCADLASKISSQTKLVWLEAAGSVTLEFPDLCQQVRICKAAGVLSALDNTWGAGLAFKPFDLVPGAQPALAVDISIHALTKYPSGGGDVLMGSVVTVDEQLHMQIKLCHMRMGFGVGANDAEAVLRSLPTLPLRYNAHDETTRVLARWCEQRSEFTQVLHPALPNSPGHIHWQRLCKSESGSAAGLLSVIFNSTFSQSQVDAFCDALRLFKIGYSWGGPISLVVPYELTSMRQTWPGHLRKGILVRLSIGLESASDLRADLSQALASMR
jgi:cystathionine beta-lyase